MAAAAQAINNFLGSAKPAAKRKKPAVAEAIDEEIARQEEADLVKKAKLAAANTGLSADLMRIMSDERTADITILVGEDKVPVKAHKVILAARSEVLYAELFGGMKESTASTVEVPDASPLSFRQLIRYLYTDRLELDKDADKAQQLADLLYLVGKYLLTPLREECNRQFLDCVTADNCWQVFELARIYEMPDLLSVAIGSIVKHIDLLAKSPCEQLFELSIESLCSLLQSGFIQLAKDRLKIARAWFDHKKDESFTQGQIDDVYRTIKLHELPLHMLYAQVITTQPTPSAEFVRDLLLYRAMPGVRLCDPVAGEPYRRNPKDPRLRFGFWGPQVLIQNEALKADVVKAGFSHQSLVGDRHVKQFQFRVTFKQRYKTNNAPHNNNTSRLFSFGFASPNWIVSDDARVAHVTEEDEHLGRSIIVCTLKGLITFRGGAPEAPKKKIEVEVPRAPKAMRATHNQGVYGASIQPDGSIVFVDFKERKGCVVRPPPATSFDINKLLPIITCKEGCVVELLPNEEHPVIGKQRAIEEQSCEWISWDGAPFVLDAEQHTGAEQNNNVAWYASATAPTAPAKKPTPVVPLLS